MESEQPSGESTPKDRPPLAKKAQPPTWESMYIRNGIQLQFEKLPCDFPGFQPADPFNLEVSNTLSQTKLTETPATLEDAFQADSRKTLVYDRYSTLGSNTCEVQIGQVINLQKYLVSKHHQSQMFADKINPATANDECTLSFESRFESGNLARALKITSNEYNLLMQNDVNSKGNTQWFFFRVTVPAKPPMAVKLNLMNFGKSKSLYTMGMKVLCYSISRFERESIGWYRTGKDVTYTDNGIPKPGTGRNYFSLSFSHTFDTPGDLVYFAYSLPYTYSSLLRYVKTLPEDVCAYREAAVTLAGNSLPLITLGKHSGSARKPVIVVTARAHPGETVSSWVMQGLLNFLTEPSVEARTLRFAYEFRVFPMLNVDGVVQGSYRANASGMDLNRQWTHPDAQIHPTVHAAKRVVRKLADKRRTFELVLDLHGHSRAVGQFTYACPALPRDTNRLFPLLLQQATNANSTSVGLFDLGKCRFSQHKSKQSTMRVVLFRRLKCANTFTIETSLGGMRCPDGSLRHLTEIDLLQQGRNVGLAMLELLQRTRPAIFAQAFEGSLPRLSEISQLNLDYEQEGAQSSSGSDSCPDEDELDMATLRQIMPKGRFNRPPLAKHDRCRTATAKSRLRRNTRRRSILSVSTPTNRERSRSKSPKTTLASNDSPRGAGKRPISGSLRIPKIGVRTYLNAKGVLVHD